MERLKREYFCNFSQALKMESNFDATTERECSLCLFDLHLSAVGCRCSSDRYACLNHAKHLCQCAWGTKFFLFRYEINELNILVEALEGKLSAIYRWAKLDLGLALSSYISRDNTRFDKLSYPLNSTILKVKSEPSDYTIKEVPEKEKSGEITLNLNVAASETSFQQKSSQLEAVSTSLRNSNIKLIKEEPVCSSSHRSNPVCRLSQEDMSYDLQSSTKEKCVLKKPSNLGKDNVILLSDDEGDEPEKPVAVGASGSSAKHAELCVRPEYSEDKVRSSNHNKGEIMFMPLSSAAMSSQRELSLADVQKDNSSSHPEIKVARDPTSGTLSKSNMPNLCSHGGMVREESGGFAADSTICRDPSDQVTKKMEDNLQHGPSDGAKSNNENNHEKVATTSTSPFANSVRNIGNASSSQSNLDRSFRQKGPRIAKVVRRINCSVEPLEYGVVLAGKSWCNSKAIFPKGMQHFH